jgi:hypothetical protein
MRQEFLGRLGRALRNWFDEEARHKQLPRAWFSLLSRLKENTSYKKNCVSLRTRACQHQAAAPSRAIYLNSSGAALNGARALGGSLLAWMLLVRERYSAIIEGVSVLWALMTTASLTSLVIRRELP